MDQENIKITIRKCFELDNKNMYNKFVCVCDEDKSVLRCVFWTRNACIIKQERLKINYLSFISKSWKIQQQIKKIYSKVLICIKNKSLR